MLAVSLAMNACALIAVMAGARTCHLLETDSISASGSMTCHDLPVRWALHMCCLFENAEALFVYSMHDLDGCGLRMRRLCDLCPIQNGLFERFAELE
ncbi:hypothetical protein CTI14_44335 [Methylobacterium radiotolerans]|nr:hypothetical protein CTI14_44335 [Methylobacterium radiotolerans]